MAEVERAVGSLDEHPARHELLERRNDLLVAAAARIARRVRVERPPQHSGGSDDLRGELTEGGETGPEQVANGAGDRPVGSVDTVSRERVEVLDDEEWQAAALPVETSAEIAVSSRALDKLRDVRGGQTAEGDNSCSAISARVGEQASGRVHGRNLL